MRPGFFLLQGLLVTLICFSSLSAKAGLSPEHQKLFDHLKKRLVVLEGEINKGSTNAIPDIDFSDQLLRLGDYHANIPLLRARLIHYDIADSFDGDPHLYDSILFDAVKKFQSDHGLKADGIIGPITLKMINRSASEEKQQIEANIKRLVSPEWYFRPDLRIEVDVARYWLTAYEEGQIIFEMPVVVGTPERQTNIFSTVMNGVRLNPGWTLPPTIKAEDYIPKLRDNPEWVSAQGVTIYTSWDKDAEPIDPTTVDWSYLSDNDIKAMRFYKQAGDSNPLGRFRFLMNNQYDIYLHDTNQKTLFNRAFRSKSSGCVRVSDPMRITEYLMADNPDWTPEKLQQILDEGETIDLRAKRSIPVYFDYKTAWLNKDDELVLGYDIYDFDAESDDGIINPNHKTLTNQKTLEE